ncbi:MAG: DUF3465 domain-containing protein [Acidobacteria bacterium]|nr:DUF3465 domain-containing protein [Acidobacteriota bacterium]
MRSILLVLSLVLLVAPGCSSAPSRAPHTPLSESNQTPLSESDQEIARAFEQGSSNVQVKGRGVVRKILSDDNDGKRHQRFVVALESGQTVVIAHNIDLAPRVRDLREGDRVEFSGEYEWNQKGGVVHWTHHDPRKRHPAGWLKHNSITYQ